MKFRIATALFALCLPLCAQEPAAAEVLFYKAFWMEKGERNKAQALALYEQFLNQAPEHALAKNAARFQFDLLVSVGKQKEADTFAKKYEKLLGNVAVAAPRGDGDAAGGGGDRAAGGAPGRPAGAGGDGAGAGGRRGRATPEQLAEMKKQLEEAKAAGDEEKVKTLEAQITRMERAAAGGDAGRGQGGAGGRRGGAPVEFAKMTKEQLDEFKTTRLEGMARQVTRMRENGQEEPAKQLEESVAAVKKALDDNKLDEAQKLYDKMMETMRGRRRGGGGGGN